MVANKYNWVVVAMEVQCIDSEKEALLMFKEGFTSPSTHFSSWFPNEDCCKWIGVKCNNKTGHVITLDLHSQDSFKLLQGQLCESLLDLPYLSYLDLSLIDFNQIPIPEFIGSLYNLKYLNLSNANFKGIIPNHLGNLSSLQFLDLSGNNFCLKSNNLDWISGLSSLEVLDLGGVDLSNAINWLDSINMLSSLVNLNLFSCQLQKLQQYLPFVNFTSLEFLDLSYNRFYSPIPNWLVEISHTLHFLNLARCQLQGSIPDSLVNFTSLSVLDFSYNNLTGSIPNNLGNMASLLVLDLTFNSLEGSIPTNLGLVQELHLSYNKLNGSLARILPLFSGLVVLEVASNSLQGLINEVHLQNFSSLQVLDLSANKLILNFSSNWIPAFQLNTIALQSCIMGPRFPQWLQNQKNVLKVDISNSNISDTIPNWFWDLSPSMKYLNLSFNDLRGKLPDLSPGASLLALDLSHNLLNGPLPHFPFKMESLILSGNAFSGPISPICDIVNEDNTLSHLDLSENILSGFVPDCWTNGQKMFFLDLGYNMLSGQIPDSIGHLVNLKVLTLASNNFSGEVPNSLRSCANLFYLGLQDNALSGNIPGWMGENIVNLQILLLRNNMFEGNIPLQLCQLKYIIVLDLSFNSISGKIPRCINNFLVIAEKEEDHSSRYYDYASYAKDELNKEMWKESQGHGFIPYRVIDFSSNRLTKEIPREVTELVGLAVLDLSNNQLTGTIPSDIGEMRSLEYLDLSRNQLSCSIPTSISNLSFLGFLNLSDNKLSGEIPSDNQLLIFFDETSFLGNLDLCGLPLTSNCSKNKSHEDPSCIDTELKGNNKANKGHGFEISPFYISIGVGFIAGFWGFWIPLVLNKSWRHAYFRFVENMIDQIYVWVVVAMARLQSKFQSPETHGDK